MIAQIVPETKYMLAEVKVNPADIGFLYIGQKVRLKLNDIFMSFLFILSGALCSLIDKIFYGGSLDFIGISNLFIADIKDLYISL